MNPSMTSTTPRWWVRLGPAGAWLLLAAATAWVLRFNPTDRIADPTGPCLWHALTSAIRYGLPAWWIINAKVPSDLGGFGLSKAQTTRLGRHSHGEDYPNASEDHCHG